MFKKNQLINLNKLTIKYLNRAYSKMLSDNDKKGIKKNQINFESKNIHQLKNAHIQQLPKSLPKSLPKPFISKLNNHNNQNSFDDSLGSWNKMDSDFSILFNQSVKQGLPIPKITVDNASSASLIGRRNKNEDRIRIKELMPNLLYFAVYDGHGGSLCAQFCQNYMEEFILFRLKESNGELDLRAVLEKAFIDINNVFAHFLTFNNVNREEEKCGTTATVCLLRNSVELVVAHVGDSRAILCRNGKAQRLTVDHTGDLFSEKERVQKSGGQIIRDNLGRCLVNGRLAMTRSIGDYDLKPFGVTAVPDTKEVEIKHGKDAFLILTTDGINYVLSDEEIVATVNTASTINEAAQFVAEQAMVYSSEDNASSLVVQFGSWNKYNSKINNTKFQFGRQLNMSSRC